MTSIVAQKHYVTFASPGTFVAETTTMEIESWDVETACKMAAEIVERHGARPYGFRFTTRGRTAKELDSKEIAGSGFYFINCRVETRDEVLARDTPREDNARFNLRQRPEVTGIARPKSGWDGFYPIGPKDTVLDFELPPIKKEDTQ